MLNLGAEDRAPSLPVKLRALGRLIESPDNDRVDISMWVTAVTPSRFERGTFLLEERGDDRHKGVLQIGPLRETLILDNSGTVVSGSFMQETARAERRRVWMRGSPELR